MIHHTKIREIFDDDDLKESAKAIRDSFITVANEFCLTQENCPTNPTFISFEKLKELSEKGVKMFGLFCDEKQSGFVAIEKSDNGIYYMEKLAILPEYRHIGFGKKLMNFVFDYVKQENGRKVSIGIINENTVLKNWYKNNGFIETGIRTFDHLPFLVCFMEKTL
jgi:ribosomal protein S18 acetylase RimI-like enzyme